MDESPKDLVGYCGLYCGACHIHQEKIREAVDNLRRVVGAYGFDKMASELAKWEPAFQHYAEYEKVLDGLVKLFGSCPGCVSEGGAPDCAIRECCRQKNYITCAECVEMDICEKLKRYVQSLDVLRRIKAMGVNRWAEEMRKKVDEGYCYLDERAI